VFKFKLAHGSKIFMREINIDIVMRVHTHGVRWFSILF